MIYLDTSVALAFIFNEANRPSKSFLQAEFVSSRLLQYELWNRLHARQASNHRHRRARALLRRVRLIEMTPDILVRALRPFPAPARTLDGLHLATAHWLRQQGSAIEIASYDTRLLAAAAAMGLPAAPI